MSRLTDLVLGHKVVVVLFWLVAVVAGFATLQSTANGLAADFALPGQPGYVTDARIAGLYHNGGGQPPTVLVATAPRSGPDDAVEAHRVFTAAAGAVPGSRMADEVDTRDTRLLAPDGRTSFAVLFTPRAGGFGPDTVTGAVSTAVRAAAPAGWQVSVTGLTQLAAPVGAQSGTSTVTETMLGGLGALAVLAFVFGSLLAFLPLIMAVVAIPSTFLLVGGLEHLTSVSVLVEFLIALIGLGVAIDYSLLVVTRWREARDGGADNAAAVRAAMSRGGHAVLFSGLTVAISLLAMLAVPVPFLRNMALAGFFIPLVSIAVALTLLPVLLASVGPHLDRPRLRHEAHASRPWTAWGRLVLRHRVTAAAVGGALLVALMVPLVTLRLGEPSSPSLAQSGPARAGLTQLTSSGVPSGVLAPMEILTTPAAATTVAQHLTQVPGVYAAMAPPAFRAGGTGIVDVLPAAEPSTPAGSDTVAEVQGVAHQIPGMLGVGGAGPTQNDFIHAVYGSFPLMLAGIALLTFVLLARAFRSVVLAAKAVVFNVVSVGAAYGVMVLVWQYGWGSQAVGGISATGTVTVWVPIMVFAFLFGLSMDYEVFILTRMREEYDATGSTTQAVVTGIGRTGRLVTSAALILFLGFVSMSTAPDTDVKVLATGLGAGILLDAVVVRSLLVPVLVGVLGRWNWWLPDWFARILRVAPSPLPAAAEPPNAVPPQVARPATAAEPA